MIDFATDFIKVNKNIKYNLNYIKKNFDINKFLNFINLKECKWDFNGEIDNFDFKDIFEGAILPSCINKDNKDPNLNQKKLSKSGWNGSQEIALIDFFNQIPENNFDSKMIDYCLKGTFFEKIHSSFKLIKNVILEETHPIEGDKLIFDRDKWLCSHSFIKIKTNKNTNYIHTVYFTNEGYYDHPYLVNLYDKVTDEKKMIDLIISFEEKRFNKDYSFFKDLDLCHIYRKDIDTKKMFFTFDDSTGKFIKA